MKLAIASTLLGAALAKAGGGGSTDKWQAPGPDDCAFYTQPLF